MEDTNEIRNQKIYFKISDFKKIIFIEDGTIRLYVKEEFLIYYGFPAFFMDHPQITGRVKGEELTLNNKEGKHLRYKLKKEFQHQIDADFQ